MAADEKAAVAAEVIDDGILQNSTRKKPLRAIIFFCHWPILSMAK
jgi:hypothetical protein